jgi:O-antigen ligase
LLMLAFGMLVATMGVIPETAPQYLLGIFDKTSENLRSATGRVGLWRESLLFLAHRPLGGGYAAAERLLATVSNVTSSEIWDAASSHNGYLSACMAAGPVSLTILCAFLRALWRNLGDPTHAVWRLVLVVVLVNNLAISSVGGPVDTLTVVAFGLAAIPHTSLRSLSPLSPACGFPIGSARARQMCAARR